MRSLILLLTLVVAAQAQLPKFTEFLKQYGKSYGPVEALMRETIFNANVQRVKAHNALFSLGQVSYQLGVNKYSDLRQDEVNSMLKGLRLSESSTDSTENLHQVSSLRALPASVDWRTSGAVTPVKDQRQCGSCYSFSTTGAMEGQWRLRRGILDSFSEQQIVDCSRGYGNYGCDGGLMTNSYRYIYYTRGIMGGNHYPYTATNGTCRFNPWLVRARLYNYRNIQRNNETALQEAVATVGPIAIAIDASSPLFQLYRSGIYNNPTCSSTRLDHAVLLVGYGTDSLGRDFWIVKNSWGTSWGEQGYIRMTRNLLNQCGVATMASYPLV